HHLSYEMRLDAMAAIREASIRRDQIDRPDLGGTQRGRGVVGNVARDAEILGDLDRRSDTYLLGETHRRRVLRAGDGVPHRDEAIVAAGIALGLPYLPT